ncbi:MAG: aminotransferase class I/II-fold pyridoxal phosphate-dependent enzyme [Acidimicrobiales bacterium]
MDVVTDIPAPGNHGGDGARVARALGLDVNDVLDLSASMNPLARDPRPVLARHLDAIARYPDPSAATRALTAAMGVAPERLLLTNGGAEAIVLVASVISGSVVEPEFGLHPRGDGPRWRSNPHNPTGVLAPRDARAAVWDEAFYPLATGEWTRGDHDAVVVGSLTKLLACPGLRVGYVLGDPALIDACARRQPHWSLNGLASEALADLLEPVDLVRESAGVRALREELRDLLARHGLVARPSDANWLLVERPGLRDVLAREAIVVRDCASFAMPGVVRIAVPDERGLERLDAALARVAPWLARVASLRHEGAAAGSSPSASSPSVREEER